MSEDGLMITADQYFSLKKNPYIILLHKEESSRGEFDSIALRFIKMNYNCLAVDMRSGNRYGFIINETSVRAKEKGYNTSLYESLKDVNAAIEYVRKINLKTPFILLGSSFSSSLALITAKNDPDIKAIIAFSPGEFFLPEMELINVVKDYTKPVFAGFSLAEYPFFASDLMDIQNEHITLFKPSHGPGTRTAEALLSASANAEEYWFALLVFIRSIR